MSFKMEGEGDKIVGDVTMKARGWSDVAKEFRRPLEVIKCRETDSPLRASRRSQPC